MNSLALAPALKRPQPANLADRLIQQQIAIRNRSSVPVGYVMRMQLGVDDDSPYFQDPVNSTIASITRRQGLTFEWDQSCYPHMTEMGARGSGVFLFPDGVKSLPLITDPRSRRLHVSGTPEPKIPQRLDYFTNSIIIDRNGMTYYVLQPILQIAIRIPTTFVILDGQTPDRNGRHAALLFSKNKRFGVHQAFLVFGNLRFI